MMIGFKNWATILVEASNNLAYRVLLASSWPSATAVIATTIGIDVGVDDFRLWSDRYQPSVLPLANAPTAADKLFYRLGEGVADDTVNSLKCPNNCIPTIKLVKIANLIIDGNSISAIQADLDQFRDAQYPDTSANFHPRQQLTNIRDHVGPGLLKVPVHLFFPCVEGQVTPLY